MPPATDARRPKRPVANAIVLLLLWVVFYGSFTLFTPPLLDDADSVHAEVAREMLLRHDWVTLYANGIRYLEKAPLLYWSMAASFTLFGVSAAAARIPLALTVLALAFAVEAFARRAFRSAHAGLYAGLIVLSSFGIFIFTRILIPDAMLCLWLTLAILCFWLTEQQAKENARAPHPLQPHRKGWDVRVPRLLCYAFASCCALGVPTKGLIGIVFPIGVVTIYLLLTRGLHGAIARVRQLHPLSSFGVFLAIAAPWHILIALANPTQGHPGNIAFAHGHWVVPLPTEGNVHGWLWFYFVNEHLLRYLNLRVPRDYDTVPLWLFWGLCLVWLMPWSAFLFKALGYIRYLFKSAHRAIEFGRWRRPGYLHQLRAMLLRPNAEALLIVWAALPLLFFSFSTRQEYYVLPSLPPLAILIAGWLGRDSRAAWKPVTNGAKRIRRANIRIVTLLLVFGIACAAASLFLFLHSHVPASDTDLASLLQQHPGDYALSMGHVLDLNAQALGLFRVPLFVAGASFLVAPLASLLLWKRANPHVAVLALAGGAFGVLLAAYLGLRTFAPVLSSAQLAAAIAPQLRPGDLIVIHQEYEYASTLGFYLRRSDLHILEGRSSNLWYGSFFSDAPAIFETPQTLAQKWPGPQRIFVWQDLANLPSPLPSLPGPVYVVAKSGGKEIVSNRPNIEMPNADLHRTNGLEKSTPK